MADRSRVRGSKTGQSLERYKTRWRSALRWRKAVERELASIELTFTEWVVLDTADELIRETKNAVSQSDIAARAELEKMTVSLVARKLEHRGLLSREPSFGGRAAWRIFLTKEGDHVVRDGRELAELACTSGGASPGEVRKPSP